LLLQQKPPLKGQVRGSIALRGVLEYKTFSQISITVLVENRYFYTMKLRIHFSSFSKRLSKETGALKLLKKLLVISSQENHLT
jgi:hypothetical protein